MYHQCCEQVGAEDFLEMGERLRIPDAVSWQACSMFKRKMEELSEVRRKRGMENDGGGGKGNKRGNGDHDYKNNNKVPGGASMSKTREKKIMCQPQDRRTPSGIWKAYFLYKACRQQQCPILLRQVAVACDVSERTLWKHMLQQKDYSLLKTFVSAEQLFNRNAALFTMSHAERRTALQTIRTLSRDYSELGSKTILSYALFHVLGPERRKRRKEERESQKRVQRTATMASSSLSTERVRYFDPRPTAIEVNGFFNPQCPNQRSHLEKKKKEKVVDEPLTARERAIQRWGRGAPSAVGRLRGEKEAPPFSSPQPVSARTVCQAVGTSTTTVFRLRKLLSNNVQDQSADNAAAAAAAADVDYGDQKSSI